MSKIIPIILAGGSGSRLWPLSREHYPKQLLSLVTDRSLLQETIKRTQDIPEIENPIIICNKQYRFLIADQMLALGIQNPKLILEPTGRNTAPAIAIAAHIVETLYPNPLLLVLPADHIIQENDIFIDRIKTSKNLAEQGNLITFGVTPTYPETGYGYIKSGKALNEKIYAVKKFIEKPAHDLAEKYLKEGDYYWNSGMFFFKAKTYLEELKKHAPSIAQACENEIKSLKQSEGFYLLSDNFSNCPSESIDYAIMEHSQKVLISPLPVKWNDMGSWTALCDVLPKDNKGNIIQGDVISIDTENSYIRSESRLIATAGVKNHIIVETQDAVMVVHKNYAQKVKDIFTQLKDKARTESLHHQIVQRPWGTYEILIEGPYYRVKHITVKPGASLSAQAHKYRAEHWIILKGTATLKLNETIKTINTYESTFIPANQMHQLSNHGTIPLEIIEVQAGDDLSEEDIYHQENH